MSKLNDCYSSKNEIFQNIESRSISELDDIMFVHALRIFDQCNVKKRITRNIGLSPEMDVNCPFFTYKGIDSFRIVNISIISKTSLKEKCNQRRYEFLIDTEYNILYSDGVNQLIQPDKAIFNLTLSNVYCPDFITKCYPQKFSGVSPSIIDDDGMILEVAALADELGNAICPQTGALILDICTFFIITFGRYTQLAIPSYDCFFTSFDKKCSKLYKLTDGG